jgi:hypothetical protein
MTSSRRYIGRTARVTSIVLAALLLQACGGGSGGTASGTASQTNTPPTNTPPTNTPPTNALPTNTGSATVSWNPPTTREDGSPLTDLAGFKVYYGSAPDNLGTSISLQDASMTSYVVSNLSAHGTYYFSVTAVDSTGGESPFSGIVSKTL